MASYEALRHVTIGQYLPTGSVVHRLDARIKLLGLLLCIVAVLLATSYTANVLLLLLVLALVRLARLPIRYILSSVIPALPVILVLSLFQLLFYPAGQGGSVVVLLSWGPIVITSAAVRMVIVALLRFADLFFLTSLLTNTTTNSALTHGIESLLRPLNVIGLPGHEIALIAAIALRFVPILGEQLESISQAQASRSVVSMAEGRLRFISNARRLAKLIVPLFVDAYRRSEEMVMAMQARCYQGGSGRTHLARLSLAARDYVALTLSVALVAFIVGVQHMPLP